MTPTRFAATRSGAIFLALEKKGNQIMGQFISMSGVVGGDEESVVRALSAYAEHRGGSMASAKLTAGDNGCMIVSEGTGGVTAFYPDDFFDWDDASSDLSTRLGLPVFSFHIHDGDLWMYTLYKDGRAVDQFNPVPDYWDERADTDPWKGDARTVARNVPGVKPEQISKYLVRWGDDVFEMDARTKAYPTDTHHYGDDWQLVDFITKLGFDNLIDDRGVPRGVTYRFECGSDDAGSNAISGA
jgi:hypothetical protein